MPSAIASTLPREVVDILARCDEFARANPQPKPQTAPRLSLTGRVSARLRCIYSTCTDAGLVPAHVWDDQADRIIALIVGHIRAGSMVDPIDGTRRMAAGMDSRLTDAIDDYLMGAEHPAPPDPLPDEPAACDGTALSGQGLGVANVA